MNLPVGAIAKHPFIKGPVKILGPGKTLVGWQAVRVKDEKGQEHLVNHIYLSEIKPKPQAGA